MTHHPTVLVVQHEPDTGPGWFGVWLADAGLALDARHPYAGDDLPGLDGYAGLLVLGGAMGPADDERCPWLPGTRSLLAAAVERGVPAFGICLGGELLALACGGAVRRAAAPELGVQQVTLRPESSDDPVFGGLPDAVEVLQWHWEEIAALPEGAAWLAAGAACPHQVFRVGAAAWGVQGHPEVTTPIATGWARQDSPLVQAVGLDPAALVGEMAEREVSLAQTWRPVAERFAGVVHEYAGARPRHH